jgi:hypothetical protein
MKYFVCIFEKQISIYDGMTGESMRSPRDFGMQVRPVGSRCWFSCSLVGDGGKKPQLMMIMSRLLCRKPKRRNTGSCILEVLCPPSCVLPPIGEPHQGRCHYFTLYFSFLFHSFCPTVPPFPEEAPSPREEFRSKN